MRPSGSQTGRHTLALSASKMAWISAAVSARAYSCTSSMPPRRCHPGSGGRRWRGRKIVLEGWQGRPAGLRSTLLLGRAKSAAVSMLTRRLTDADEPHVRVGIAAR